MKTTGGCPFCTGLIHLDATAEPPYTAHTLPPCATYSESDDALDFVMKCNAELRRRAGQEKS